MEVGLWVTVGVSALVYVVVGALLVCRRHRREISSRSPWMLTIAHCAILLDLLLLYQEAWKFRVTSSNYHSYYLITSMTCHYLYYFPYLLRCYRLKFVFTLDSTWDNTYFKANIRRSTQNWLLCVLLVLMLPVLGVAVLIAVYPEDVNVVPANTSGSGEVRAMAIYELVCFVEEVLFVLAVFQLRHVQDHFSMTKELTIVCSIWLCNSVFSRYSKQQWWVYECIGRNWALMLVSSLWPVYNSFKSQGFTEPITTEVAHSLKLVLQNQFTLTCFERFLERSQDATQQNALMALEFWLECEIYRCEPTAKKAEDIYEKYIARHTLGLPESIKHGITVSRETADPSGHLYISAQELTFEQLREFFFQFQLSPEYSKMMREVLRQEIYLNRVVVTSLRGELIY